MGPSARTIARVVLIVVLSAFALYLVYHLAALIGGTLLGVLGALLAIPSAATIQIAVREYRDYRRLAGAGSL